MSGNDRSGAPDGVPDDDRPPGSSERPDARGEDDAPSEGAPASAGGSATATAERTDAPPSDVTAEELTLPPRSLHPRVRIVWVLQGLVTAAFLGALAYGLDAFVLGVGWLGPAAFLAVGTLVVVHAVFRYRIWTYEVREDALYLERGVLTRVRTVVPYVRIQHVDASRGPLERTAGLASSVVYTAGSRGADVTIPGLTPEKADDLQERLKQLAILAEGDDAV